ncbi:hypothetical protein ACRC6Q_18995 [Planococcus sp. SE5232]|uniref:hypothetical protein n=1 Tax=unclassified Planococcus (in: firmicutes) TaxID=2662419 RepID=UPI003D6C19C7
MENFTDRIIIKNGVLLDKKDLIQLEELLKSGDINTDYGESLQNNSIFKITINYLKEGKEASFRIKSMSELKSDHEKIEVNLLIIEKLEFGKNGLKKRIELAFTKNTAYAEVISDDILWLKSKVFLLEDFFKRRESNSGKYNTWISEKLFIYVGVTAGILGGIGFGFKEPNLIIIAATLLVLSGVISNPKIRNKLFRKHQIMLKEKTAEKEKVKKDKLPLKILIWSIKYVILPFLVSLVAGVVIDNLN